MKSCLIAIIMSMCSMIYAQSLLWEPGGVCVAKNTSIEWKKQAVDYPDGSVVICWKDFVSGYGQIWGMRYASDGMPMWESPALLTDSNRDCYGFTIIAHPDGGFYLGYCHRYSEDDNSLYLQRFSADHQPLWGFGANLAVLDDEYTDPPQCLPDGEGGIYTLINLHSPHRLVLKHLDQDGVTMPGFEALIILYNVAVDEAVMIPDGFNGVVIGYSTGNELRILRIDDEGNAVWGNTGVLIDSGTSIIDFQLSPLPDEMSAVAWRVGSGDIRGQKVSSDGETLLESPLTLFGQPMFGLMNIDLTTDLSGNVFYAYQIEHQCYIQKWAADSTFPWGENGVVLSPGENRSFVSIAILADYIGGCRACYGECESDTAKTHFIRVDASGEITDQCELDSQRAAFRSLMINNGNRNRIIYFDNASWREEFAWSLLSQQIIDQEGNLLIGSDETTVARGILPYRQEVAVIPVGGNYYHFWCSQNNTVKMQKQDSGGHLVFNEAGIDIVRDAFSIDNQAFPSVVYSPEEHLFYVAYTKIHEGFLRLCLQIVDENSALQWEEPLPLVPAGISVGRIVSDIVDGQVVIWWDEVDYLNDPQCYAIKMQRFQNGVPHLAEWGVTIAELEDGDCRIVYAENGYLLWKGINQLRLSHIDPNGEASPGWPTDGVLIATTSIKSYLCESDGIHYVIYRIDGDDFYRVQAFGSDGTPLWEGQGVELDENVEIFSAKSTTHGVLVLANYHQTPDELRLLRIDESGEIMWTVEVEPGVGVWGADLFDAPTGVGVVYTRKATPTSDWSVVAFQCIRPNGTLVLPQPLLIDDQPAYRMYLGVRNISETAGLVTWDTDYGPSYTHDVSHKSQMIDIQTAAAPDIETPGLVVTLDQARPNPFNPETTISYAMPQDGNVHIAVYNIKGQLVKKLLDESQTAGQHKIVWDGRDNEGRKVASGVYLYRVETGRNTATRKMLLLK